jgi:hypothetical protein
MVPTIVFAGIILALMTGGILFVVNYIQNQPDTPSVANSSSNNTNVAANTDDPNSASNTITVTPDQIRIEFRALSEKVSVTSTVDGNLGYDEVLPETPKTYTAQDRVKLRYYRGFADKVQISLNGKQIAAPPAPAKGNIEFEINKENVARILESGVIVEAAPAAAQSTPQPAPAASESPAATATNTAGRPSPTPARPAFTPQPTPRRSPTPIVVGRPPTPRPSPE